MSADHRRKLAERFERVAAEAAPPVDVVDQVGAALLDEVLAFIARYVAAPSQHALVAIVLWVAHCHALDAFESSPRLALLSPEPGSGKTRTLEVVELLTPRPMHALNASVPAVFRSIAAARPTLLLDEVDALWSGGKDDPAADLRALLNAGHRRGATIPRCVGPTHGVTQFPVYCPVALAGLGDLPDTLMSRSIVVRMRRRAPGEVVQPFRYRTVAPEGHELRRRLAEWVTSVVDDLDGAWPEMPDGVTDRPADVWEGLLAVADAAGGHWPETARAACVELCKVVADRDASLGIRLLADLKMTFGDEVHLATETVLERLHRVEEAPWSDLRGKPLDARGLARRLGAYGVKSTKVRVGDATFRGYRAEDLFDSWSRYLSPPSQEAEHPEQPEQARSAPVPDVPPGGRVPEQPQRPEQDAPPPTCTVPHVPDVPPQRGTGPGNPSEEAANTAVALVLDAFPGAELVPEGLVDLPLGRVEPCRVCRATAAVADDLGPVCRTCRGAA